jgi:hypothetical protein
MPFGMRWLARELQRELRATFGEEDDASIAQAVGQLLFTKYLSPALMCARPGSSVLLG